MLQGNPDKFYVFGDNVLEIGNGGQAAEMRGEPNAIGVPTKWQPAMRYESFFNDADFKRIKVLIDKKLDLIETLLFLGKTVVIPADGIGTGLAMLEKKAPQVWDYLQERMEKLESYK